jgi:hypothetical protein
MTRPDPQPSLRPTNPATLLVAALAAAAVAWLAISRFYGDLPTTLPWLPPITLFGLAALEAVLAANTRARIDRRPGTEPVDPLAVARYAVLAKASSLAGALFGGFYAGVLSWLLSEFGTLSSVDRDLPQAVAGGLAGPALVAAALWLERACRVPARPDADEQPGPGDPEDDRAQR